MSRISQENRRKYVTGYQDHCPFCGSENIEGDGQLEQEDGNVWQTIRCLECKEEWQDVYAPIGVETQEELDASCGVPTAVNFGQLNLPAHEALLYTTPPAKPDNRVKLPNFCCWKCVDTKGNPTYLVFDQTVLPLFVGERSLDIGLKCPTCDKRIVVRLWQPEAHKPKKPRPQTAYDPFGGAKHRFYEEN